MFPNCRSNCSNSCYNVHSHALILCNGNKFYSVGKQINVGSFIFCNRENISKITNILIEIKIVFKCWISKKYAIEVRIIQNERYFVNYFLEELHRVCVVLTLGMNDSHTPLKLKTTLRTTLSSDLQQRVNASNNFIWISFRDKNHCRVLRICLICHCHNKSKYGSCQLNWIMLMKVDPCINFSKSLR